MMEHTMIKILAIDDNQDNLINLKAVLNNTFPQANLITALNGEKGIELAKIEDPDVILLDIVRSDMNGFDVCKKLKADKKLNEIPVVFITALKSDKDSRNLALECGGDGFLSKPIDESELTAQIRAMVKIKSAKIDKRNEKDRLALLVDERTSELKKEIAVKINTEEVLRQNELKYFTLFQHAPLGYQSMDKNGTILEVNEMWLSILKYSKNEVIGKWFGEFLHPDQKENFKKNLLEYIKTHDLTQKNEYHLIKKDGGIVIADYTIRIEKDRKGNFISTHGVFQDITEKRRIKKSIEQASVNWSRTFDAIQDGIILMDTNQHIIQCNQTFLDFTKKTKDEVIGQKCFTFLHGTDCSIDICPFNKMLKSKKREFEEMIVLEQYCEVMIDPILDKNNNIIGAVHIVKNISERKQAEIKLIQSNKNIIKREKLYSNLIKNMMEGFAFCKMLFEKDQPVDFIYLNVNKVFENFIELKNVKGKKVTEIIPGIKKSNPELFQIFGETALTGKHNKFESYIDQLNIYFSVSVYSPQKGYFIAIFDDITLRKKTDELVKRSESHYKAITSTANVAIITTHGNGIIVDWNPAAEKIFGYKKEYILLNEINISTLIPEKYHNGHLQGLLRIQEKKIFGEIFELEGMDIHGIVFPIELSLAQWNINDELFFTAIIRDISYRKKIEIELIQREETFRKIFEDSPIGMVMSDLTFNFSKTNSAFENMIGYSKKELLKMSFIDITHPDNLNKDVENINKLINGEITNYKTEKKYIKKNGQTIWGNLSVSRINDNQGNFQFNIGMVEDITILKSTRTNLEQLVESRTTDLKKVNEMLETELLKGKKQSEILSYSENLNRTTINAIKDYIIIIDKEFKILMSNNAVSDLLVNNPEFKFGNIIGHKINELFPSLTKETVRKINNVFESGIEISFNTTSKIFNHSFMFLEISLLPIQIYNKVDRIVLYAKDITKIKQVEEEIAQNLLKEKELNQLKSRFISILSHEFRTPLAGIQSSIELIEKYDAKMDMNKKRELYKNIYKSIRHTNSILEDISFIGKEQNGKINLTASPVEIEKLCNFCINDIKANYAEANIYTDIPSGIKANIDEVLMRQVIVNLLSNAVKYSSSKDPIEFIVRIEDEQLLFKITDKGIGIPKEDLKYVFDAFHRAKNTSGINGTGLGLTIVKRCIEYHNGSIEIVNNPIGTTFIIRIPL